LEGEPPPRTGRSVPRRRDRGPVPPSPYPKILNIILKGVPVEVLGTWWGR
jgi:hypothetical protein